MALFYALALALWAAAVWLVRADPLALVALLPAALHLGWQVRDARPRRRRAARWRGSASNRFAGLLVFLACVVVGHLTRLAFAAPPLPKSAPC